jgi:hypothetical protein
MFFRDFSRLLEQSKLQEFEPDYMTAESIDYLVDNLQILDI